MLSQESQRVFKICFCFVLLYNKSLNDWSLGKQRILFPENLNVFRDEVEGNIEIRGKQSSLIKCFCPRRVLASVRRHPRTPRVYTYKEFQNVRK